MTLWAWIKQTLRGEYFSQNEARQRARFYASFVSDQILKSGRQLKAQPLEGGT